MKNFYLEITNRNHLSKTALWLRSPYHASLHKPSRTNSGLLLLPCVIKLAQSFGTTGLRRSPKKCLHNTAHHQRICLLIFYSESKVCSIQEPHNGEWKTFQLYSGGIIAQRLPPNLRCWRIPHTNFVGGTVTSNEDLTPPGFPDVRGSRSNKKNREFIL